MPKKKTKESAELQKIKGIFYKGVLWYYDSNADFIEAWPGFKLWFEVDTK